MNTEKWICDKCKQDIDQKEDGYVEWLRSINNGNISDFHVVHQKSCLYNEKAIYKDKNSTAPGYHLESFLEEDGLMRLLRLLDDQKLVNRNEVIELIKRFHITGYETARFYLEEAYSDELIEAPNSKGYYYPFTSQIDEINTNINENGFVGGS